LHWWRGAALGAATIGATLVAAGPASAAPTVPAWAGPPVKPKVNALDFDQMFPKTITIRVGQSVRWTINGFHDVALPAKGQSPPPFALPLIQTPVTGITDAAGKALWFNGQPTLSINPQVANPAGGSTYNGSSYVNSGLPLGPGAPKPYTLKFTKAGTFKFYCLVHPGMQGTVKVLAAKAKGKTTAPGQARTLARKQETQQTTKAKTLAKVKPPAGQVFAGNDTFGGVTWLRFFPDNVTIKAGQSVMFASHSRTELHTVTFGPAAYVTQLENNFVEPLPGTAPPVFIENPLGAYPSDPPPLPAYDATNHGNGFLNAGGLQLGGPTPSTATITFTKPGVYKYDCLVHPGMEGTVTVTP
jgi:plastocyanin